MSLPNELVSSKTAFILSTEQFFDGRVDNDRSYPSTGMTTERWGEIPVTDVPLEGIYATQYEVSANRIRYSAEHPYNTHHGGDAYPLFVEHDGKVFLEDGHHRVVAEMAAGAKSVRGRKIQR